MNAFIVDYFEWVKGSLGDPSFSKRISDGRLLREMEVAHQTVHESVLRIHGRLSYAEATITLKDEQEFYALPGNFRRFKALQQRTNDDPNQIAAAWNILQDFERAPGIKILSGQQGFKMQPVPTLTDNVDVVLMYQMRPIIMHYGTAREVGDGFIDFENSPAAAQGEVITTDDYYKGSLIGIVSADTGVGQIVECVNYTGAGNRATLRHNFTLTPTGTVVYEIRPILPRPYHKLIALTAAITFAAERRDFEGRKALISEWRELWRAAKNYFGDESTADTPRFRDVEKSGNVDPYELHNIFY